jgi:glucose-1-phosphate thymidylyltransferase
MAGKGKRMRPHTLTTPKPLIKLAGRTIVHHLLYEIREVLDEPIEEINFIVGDFGSEVEKELLSLARELEATGKISYQQEALGTAHAVQCAKESLEGKVIIAFADTLFNASFKLDTQSDGIIWTKQVEDPSAFGVVKKDENGLVTGFYEKPKEFVSDEAIIGVYYFKKGEDLQNEIQFLLDNQITGNGEYQLTDALENLRKKGNKISTSIVDKWFDCGNKKATVDTNKEMLKYLQHNGLRAENYKLDNSIVIEPCYIGKDVNIINSVVGPYVSIENNTCIENALIKNSIIQSNTHIKNLNISDSMIGNHAEIIGKPLDVSAGDYTNLKY